jgi:hypothetical protein
MSSVLARRSRWALSVLVIVMLVGVVALTVRTHPRSARCNAWQAQIGWEAADRARHGPPPGAAISPTSSQGTVWASWVSVLRETKAFVGQDGEVNRPPDC